MEKSSGHNITLPARVEELLRNEKSKMLFRALILAQERGGAREVIELVTRALNEERAMRAEDAEGESGDGQ